MRPLPHKSFGSDQPHPRHAAKAEKPTRRILEPQHLIDLGWQTRHDDLLTLADPTRPGLIQSDQWQMGNGLREPDQRQGSP